MQPPCGCSVTPTIPHANCIPKLRALTPTTTAPSTELPISGNAQEILQAVSTSELADHESNLPSNPLTSEGAEYTTFTSLSTGPPRLPCWDDFGEEFDQLLAAQEQTSPKYDLRPGPRDPDKVQVFPWLDQDASTTYDPFDTSNDPYLRPITETSTRPKRPAPERTLDDAQRRIKTPRLNNWLQGRREGKRLITTLRFKEKHGELDRWGTSLDHWPDAAFINSDGKLDWEKWWNQYKPSPNSEMHFSDTYGLRDRGALGPTKWLTDEEQDLEPDDLTLGHPAARGCKACFELRTLCPLVEGAKYPCTTCIEDSMECGLILEPPIKKSCNACSKKRIVCPFAADGKIRGPCQPCEQAGMTCVAGPKGGLTRTGPALKGHEDEDDCTFAPLRAKRKRKPRAAVSSELSRPLSEFINSKEPHWKKTITTRLAHPIRFNYKPHPDSTAVACHWCNDVLYGLLGLEELTVQVVDRDPPIGYIELSGGHTELGYPSSKMCESCTFERVTVALCSTHELQAIEGMNPHIFDFNEVVDYMMPGMASKAPWQWCAICPSPAFFRCDKEIKEVEGVGLEGGGGELVQKGCGLVLCDVCALALVAEHEGCLEKLIEKMEVDRKGDAFGLRADAGLLRSDGELMRRMTIQSDDLEFL